MATVALPRACYELCSLGGGGKLKEFQGVGAWKQLFEAFDRIVIHENHGERGELGVIQSPLDLKNNRLCHRGASRVGTGVVGIDVPAVLGA